MVQEMRHKIELLNSSKAHYSRIGMFILNLAKP